MYSNFMGLVPDSIDLSRYLEPEESVQVRPASAFLDRVLDMVNGRSGAIGLPFPWEKAADKFAFRPGEVTVWLGYKGHGKSMMLSQVLLHALTQEERVFIISPEFKPEGVLIRKVRQAMATATPSDSDITQFLAWAGNKRLWLFDHQGSLTPETVVGVTRYAIEELGVTHVLIDSLMKCGISPEDYPRQKQFIDELQTIAHQANIHLHLVAHARKGENDDKPPRLHDVKGTSELCDMAENVISVWKNKRKLEAISRGDRDRDDEPDALLTIDSQRNGDGWTGSLQFWFHTASFQFLAAPNDQPIIWSAPDALVEF